MSDGDSAFVSPGRPVQVLDPIGAGDAFAAGFLSAWLQGHDLESCAESANLVAAMSMTALGDFEGLPTARELKSFRTHISEADR